jgi:hypothetical protein
MKPAKRIAPLAFMPNAEDEAADMRFEHWKNIVCDIFIKALLAHDREGILELANAAEFFKDKLDDDYVPADPERYKLLKLKTGSALNRPRPIRKIAEYLNGGRRVQTPADGFSALRRKCKELGIPIQHSRKISKK